MRLGFAYTHSRCGGCDWSRAPQGWRGSACGFSLIELLVTILIILILTTLYWSPNSGSRQKQLKASCANNLQKVSMALTIYANDNKAKFPEQSAATCSEEALDCLVPKYTSDTSSFICPGSKDSSLPSGESFRKRHISYAYYMGRRASEAQEVLASDKQVDNKARKIGDAAFSTDGKPPGNNHRKFGGNFLFLDGHVDPSPAHVRFEIPMPEGVVLLNPKK